MTKPNGIGRVPYKFNRKAVETILRHLKGGGFQKHAAEAAGIEWRTMRYWLERGDNGEKPYAAFAVEVRRLLAEDALRCQSIITRAQLAGDWKAAAWSLERKHPREYGQAAALAAAAAVTVRTGSGAKGDDDAVTTVQFYLPDNGRRPQDAVDDEEAGED